jgi:hypothetical protein
MKKNDRTKIVTAIILIDVLLALVMVYMIAVGFIALRNLYTYPNNPVIQQILQQYGNDWNLMVSSLFSFYILLIVVATFYFTFAFGLFKMKSWAIYGRAVLGIVLVIYYFYNCFTGKTSLGGGIELTIYDLFVVGYLIYLIKIRKIKFF